MFTILFLNQKGGVGKTTLADELSFALERRHFKVAYVSTDPQGGSVHESCTDSMYASSCHFQVVDTAGVLNDATQRYARAADLILVPLLPSTRDIEATMRTLSVVKAANPKAECFVVINMYNPIGILEKNLVQFLESENIPVLQTVRRSVMVAQAAAAKRSVYEYSLYNPVVSDIESLTDSVLRKAGF